MNSESNPESRDEIFQPLKKSARSSQLLADEIRKSIVQGRIKPGESLPSERDMAQRFQVTRNTVREALRSLEQLRLISIRQGSRITVLDYLNSAGVEFVSDLLMGPARAVKSLMGDIADAWWVIGKAMMSYAVDGFNLDHLSALEEAVHAFGEEAAAPGPDLRRLQGLDYEIQNRLIQATGNQAMILLHNSMRHIYSHVADLFEPIVEDPAFMAKNYANLLECMRTGDLGQAKKAFEAYFDRGRRALAGSDNRSICALFSPE